MPVDPPNQQDSRSTRGIMARGKTNYMGNPGPPGAGAPRRESRQFDPLEDNPLTRFENSLTGQNRQLYNVLRPATGSSPAVLDMSRGYAPLAPPPKPAPGTVTRGPTGASPAVIQMGPGGMWAPPNPTYGNTPVNTPPQTAPATESYSAAGIPNINALFNRAGYDNVANVAKNAARSGNITGQEMAKRRLLERKNRKRSE